MKTLLAVICSAIVFNCTQNLHMTEQASYVKTGEEDFGMDENTMHEDNNDLTVFDYFLEDNSDDETIIFLQGKQANIPNLFLKLYPTINEEFEGLIHHAVELGSVEIIKKNI